MVWWRRSEADYGETTSGCTTLGSGSRASWRLGGDQEGGGMVGDDSTVVGGIDRRRYRDRGGISGKDGSGTKG